MCMDLIIYQVLFFNAESGQKLYECPMCRLVCDNYPVLQEHVELHLEECNFLEGKDILYAFLGICQIMLSNMRILNIIFVEKWKIVYCS